MQLASRSVGMLRGPGWRRNRVLFFAPLTRSLFVRGNSATPTYSRATAAYVQDHEGVMRQVRTGEARFWGARRVQNYLPDSSKPALAGLNFNSGANVTVTTGQPDSTGGTTAVLITNKVAAYGCIARYSFPTTTVFTGDRVVFSAVVKRGTARYVGIRICNIGNSTSPVDRYPTYDFDTGVWQDNGNSAGTYLGKGATPLPNGWVRVWIAGTLTLTSSSIDVAFMSTANGDTTAVQSTSDTGFYDYAQLEVTNGQSVWTPSEQVHVGVLSTPFYGTGVDGVQCFDTVRLHTQNLLQYSGGMTTAPWNGTDATCVAAGIASPDGYPAFTIQDNSNNTLHRWMQLTPTLASGSPTVYKASMRVRAGTKDTCCLVVSDVGFAQECYVRVTSIADMTIVTSTIAGTATATGSISDLGSGWRLVTMTITFPAPLTAAPWFMVFTGPDFNTYVGTGQTITVAGPQLRVVGSSFTDSYVETQAAVNLGTDTGATAPIASTTLLGYLAEAAGTQLVTPTAAIRGLNDASWVASGGTSTVAKTSTGVDGVANTATRVTATGANAVLMQAAPVTAAGNYVSSFYIRRVTGAGNIDITVDGTNWTTISGSINSATYTRVQVTGNLALNTARIGIRIVTSGDAVDVDFAQLESGTGATSPMSTAGASVRNADVLSYANQSWDKAQGSWYGEVGLLGVVIPNGQFMMTVDTSNAYFGFIGGGGAFSFYDGTTFGGAGAALAANTNYKLAVAWGPGAGAGLFKGKRSGDVIVSYAFDGDMGATGVNQTVYVGTNSGSIAQPNAALRNLRLYNRAMNTNQINALAA